MQEETRETKIMQETKFKIMQQDHQFQEEHHFNTCIAKKYGINPAILLRHFMFWIKKNRACKKHFYEDRTWTYAKLSELQEIFDYMSTKTIRTALDHLIRQKVLRKGFFCRNKFDRTTWYAFEDEGEFLGVPKQLITEKNIPDVPDEAESDLPVSTNAVNRLSNVTESYLPVPAHAAGETGKSQLPTPTNGQYTDILQIRERERTHAREKEIFEKKTAIIPAAAEKPTLQECIDEMIRVGGTMEMGEKYFYSRTSKGWKLRGERIVDWKSDEQAFKISWDSVGGPPKSYPKEQPKKFKLIPGWNVYRTGWIYEPGKSDDPDINPEFIDGIPPKGYKRNRYLLTEMETLQKGLLRGEININQII